MKRILIILVLFCSARSLNAQELSNFRSKTLLLVGDTVRIDSLSLVPGSVELTDKNGILIPWSNYFLDEARSLIVPGEPLRNSRVKISYRVFPYDFTSKVYHKSYKVLVDTNDYSLYTISKISTYSKRSSVFEDDQLDKRGSISRGISFGNNQDVIVNSNLNLQLSGKVSDDFQVMAAISDNNVPIQPDGNSQQIREFDKVFIQLFNEKTKIIFGDFELAKPTGEFLSLNKKGQGATISTSFRPFKEKKSTFRTSVSGAISKGKYCRHEITAKEGVQGPYKIFGCNNESYIIILAGSEKVFVDGKLMTRGQNNDYTIDYNMAEFSFTPDLPITKDRRIIIEFEYSERNYARFVVANSNELVVEKGIFWLNLYSEQDSKNQPVNQVLTTEQKQLLSEIGDSLHEARVSNIKDTLFTNDLILYELRDTTLSDSIYFDSIYVYSTNSDSAHYKLGFSYVGLNNGNYRPFLSSANGKVYAWVAPVNGVKQGNYEPVILLITPKKKQMVTMGGKYRLAKKTHVEYEFGITNNDLNTFSSKDAGDNTGYAIRVNLLQNIISQDSTQTRLDLKADYQLLNKYFDPVERFRSPEFTRDWNLSVNQLKQDEHLMHMNLSYRKNTLLSAKYDLNYMMREQGFTGLKNGFSGKFGFKGSACFLDGSYLMTSDQVNETTFLRHKAGISQTIRPVVIGLKSENEYNIWNAAHSDSILKASYSYYQWEAFIKTADTSNVSAFASYKQRKDQLPGMRNHLENSMLGDDFQIGANFLKNPNHQFRTTFNYRNLSIIDSSLTAQKAENTATGKVEYSFTTLKKALSSTTYYEIGSGLEIKKEYAYVEVAQGQGIFIWQDYNKNSVKELDEFEVAYFQDTANYIRIFMPSNDYLKIYTSQFSQTFSLRPDRVWHGAEGVKKFIARFSDQFAYRMGQKNLSDQFENYANPFTGYVLDSNHTYINSSIRNTFSFNKTNSVFGMDYLFQKNVNRMLLVNGFDTRSNAFSGVRIRWNITSKFLILDNSDIGNKEYVSQFFSAKDYTIPYFTNDATLSYQPVLSLRVSLHYTYTTKENKKGEESSLEHKAGLEVKYNALTKGSIVVTADYINIEYKGSLNTSVSYEMLQGFLPGDNATWSVIFQRGLSKSLFLDLNYNGRVSMESKVVHTGGVQIRALF